MVENPVFHRLGANGSMPVRLIAANDNCLEKPCKIIKGVVSRTVFYCYSFNMFNFAFICTEAAGLCNLAIGIIVLIVVTVLVIPIVAVITLIKKPKASKIEKIKILSIIIGYIILLWMLGAWWFF